MHRSGFFPNIYTDFGEGQGAGLPTLERKGRGGVCEPPCCPGSAGDQRARVTRFPRGREHRLFVLALVCSQTQPIVCPAVEPGSQNRSSRQLGEMFTSRTVNAVDTVIPNDPSPGLPILIGGMRPSPPHSPPPVLPLPPGNRDDAHAVFSGVLSPGGDLVPTPNGRFPHPPRPVFAAGTRTR